MGDICHTEYIYMDRCSCCSPEDKVWPLMWKVEYGEPRQVVMITLGMLMGYFEMRNELWIVEIQESVLELDDFW